MQFTIDATNRQPPYDQLRSQVISKIASGALSPGDKLPPVRQLATTLGLAANTVARAYRELETEGYVVTRGRGGTTIAHEAKGSADAAAEVDHAASAYVATLRALGMSNDAIIAATQRAL